MTLNKLAELPTFYIGRNTSGYYAINLDKSEFLGTGLATETEAINLIRHNNPYHTEKKLVNSSSPSVTEVILEKSLKNRPKKEREHLIRLAKKRDKALKSEKQAATSRRKPVLATQKPKISRVSLHHAKKDTPAYQSKF